MILYCFICEDKRQFKYDEDGANTLLVCSSCGHTEGSHKFKPGTATKGKWEIRLTRNAILKGFFAACLALIVATASADSMFVHEYAAIDGRYGLVLAYNNVTSVTSISRDVAATSFDLMFKLNGRDAVTSGDVNIITLHNESGPIFRIVADTRSTEQQGGMHTGLWIRCEFIGGESTKYFPLPEWEPVNVRLRWHGDVGLAEFYLNEIFAGAAAGPASDILSLEVGPLDDDDIVSGYMSLDTIIATESLPQ